MLEPIFAADSGNRALLEMVPHALTLPCVLVLDLLISAAFVATGGAGTFLEAFAISAIADSTSGIAAGKYLLTA